MRTLHETKMAILRIIQTHGDDSRGHVINWLLRNGVSYAQGQFAIRELGRSMYAQHKHKLESGQESNVYDIEICASLFTQTFDITWMNKFPAEKPENKLYIDDEKTYTTN